MPFRAAVTGMSPPELLVSRLMGEEQYRITIKPERLLEPCFERSLRGWKVLDFDGHTYHDVTAHVRLMIVAICQLRPAF